MGRKYFRFKKSRSLSKQDLKLLGFVLMVLLSWLLMPFVIVMDFFRARYYFKRLRALLIAFFVWTLMLAFALYFFKKDIQHADFWRVFLIVVLPFSWRLIFRPIVDIFAPIFTGKEFYSSRQWRELRYEILRAHNGQCMLCGTYQGSMHVDHIKPRSKYPHLALDPNNLQVLCAECNLGKSNVYEDDFR